MGVLSGLKVLEFEAIGPAPFCGMVLADMGADVIRVDRATAPEDLGIGRGEKRADVLKRNRRSVTLDMKSADGIAAALDLIGKADVLLEGFRPGVMERLGLGPDVALARNPKLVYGRMTGWGQAGPMAPEVGHDINYTALTGVLAAIGPAGGKPTPPLNLVGDFGGGGMLLAVGVLGALFRAQRTGQGEVIDAAMVDGASLLSAPLWGLLANGAWNETRGNNVLDGGAPWYDTYACKDGRYMAVGAIEARFYAALLERLGLAGEKLPAQHDRAGWPELRRRFSEVFLTRTRDEWAAWFAGSDACTSPVLTFTESLTHPHQTARNARVTIDGVPQPSPAPRFRNAPSDTPRPPAGRGAGGGAALKDWGFDAAGIARLKSLGLGWQESA